MSCGTAFSCGIHRFDKYKFSQQDKPANKALHDENEKRLSELLRLREQQDHGVFQPMIAPAAIALLEPVVHNTTLTHQNHGATRYYSISDTKQKQD